MNDYKNFASHADYMHHYREQLAHATADDQSRIKRNLLHVLQSDAYACATRKPVVAWDGEGKTLVEAHGSGTYAQWEAMVRDRARATFEDAQRAEAIWFDALAAIGGKIKPAWTVIGGVPEVRSEYLGLGRWGDWTSIGGEGNADELAQHVRDATGLDTTESDVLEYFSSHQKRLSYRSCLERAKRDASDDLPQAQLHVYTLLANSRGEYVENPLGLSTHVAIDFLLDHADPLALHVIFGGSYDANMLLRDLSHEDARAIWESPRGSDVCLGGRWYRVTYRQRKSLELARYVDDAPRLVRKGAKWVRNYEARIVLWDTIGFYQTSFVRAVETWFPDVAERNRICPQWDTIVRMKRERANFASHDNAEVREYCFAECRMLVALTDRLRDALASVGLNVRRFDGAGAIAKALLRSHRAKDYLCELPRELTTPCATAFAGGRIELCSIGTHVGVYDYDLCSAYPSVISQLPSLQGGWDHVGYYEPGGDRALVHIRWDFERDLPWYPFFYRLDRGEILFPPSGEGWYWSDEVDAGFAFLEQFPSGFIQVLDAWYLDGSDSRPFAWIEDVYAQRRAMQADPFAYGEKVLKLGMNSCYGAFCQQLGGTSDKAPPYFSLAYAGMITSAVRARLVRKALEAPHEVVAFMTDGIFTKNGHQLFCGTSKNLGSWECKNDAAMELIIVQPGVYWMREPGGEWQSRYRGFDRGTLDTPDAIVQAWERGAARVDIPSTRFLTLGAALASDRRFEAWCSWETRDRALSTLGASVKREPLARRDLRHLVSGCATLRVAENVAYESGAGISVPYEVAWQNAGEHIGAEENEEGTDLVLE